MKNNKGFSLVELIVVIAIMAILAAVAIPTFATFITKANKASDESFIYDLEYAVELALVEEGGMKATDVITVITADGTVNEVQLNGTKIYGTTTTGEGGNAVTTKVDTYELAKVIDFTYSFKNYKAANITITNGVLGGDAAAN